MNDTFALSSLGLLLDITLKMSLVLIAAFAVTALLRRGAASSRQVVWNLTFTGLVCLPFMTGLLPAWNSSWLPSVLLGKGLGDGAGAFTGACVAFVDASLVGFLGFLGHMVHTPLGSVSAAYVLLSVWVLGLAFLVGKAVVEVVLLQVGFVRARRVRSGRLHNLLRTASATVGLKRLPELAVGPFGVPATFGMWRAKIVLPEDAPQWSDDRLRVVLMHEAAHIRNADYPFNLMAQLVSAVLWHNPLTWVAVRSMRLERECAADDLVLDAGEARLEYAQHLYDIAAAVRGRVLSPAAAVAMAHHCPLKTRVAQILDPTARRGRLSRGFLVMGIVLSLALLAPLAAMTPPRAAMGGFQKETPAPGVRPPCPKKAAAEGTPRDKDCAKQRARRKCNKTPGGNQTPSCAAPTRDSVR